MHTNEVDVQVLGTWFNVNSRRSRSIVSLEEGKVKVLMHGHVKEVLVKNMTQQIVLTPQTRGLEEVVVVGRDTQKKVNVIDSISSIKSADLETMPSWG